MPRFLAPILFLVSGLVLVLDSCLPARMEHVAVDGHAVATSHDNGPSALVERHYRLTFNSAVIDHCNVGYGLYRRMRDGEVVDVSASWLLGRCLAIEQYRRTLYTPRISQTLVSTIGVLLLISALGVMRFNRRIPAPG